MGSSFLSGRAAGRLPRLMEVARFGPSELREAVGEEGRDVRYEGIGGGRGMERR